MVIIGKKKWNELQNQIKELEESVKRINTLAGIQTVKKGIKKADKERAWMLGEKDESTQ